MPKLNFYEFAKSAVECLYDLDSIGVAKANAILSIENKIENLLKLNDEKTLTRRHEHFNIPDTQPEDYIEKFYELNGGKIVLAGIRHKNGSKHQPFVHTLLNFVPIGADIEVLRQFASEKFQKFNPKELSIWLRPSVHLEISANKTISSRQYVVGSVLKIQKKEKPIGYDRITLKKVTADFDFKWYTQSYEDFHRTHPDLKSWVPITSKEDIDQSLSDQLLFTVFVYGTLAGLIAGQNEPLFGKPSVYISELLLDL